MPNSAPGAPISSCFMPTIPADGEISNNRLSFVPASLSVRSWAAFPTTTLPFSSRAALSWALNSCPPLGLLGLAMTLAEDLEGPMQVGIAVGGPTVQSPPFTVTPLDGMLETQVNATKL